MSDVTAAELLAKQREVADLERKVISAMSAVSAAERQLEKLRAAEREASWEAEYARDEVAELEARVEGETSE